MLKKTTLIALALLVALTGCTTEDDVNSSEIERTRIPLEIKRSVATYLEENIVNSQFLAVDAILASGWDDELEVNVRVIGGYCMASIAEEVVPLAYEVAEEHDLNVKDISIMAYSESNIDGIDSDTLIQWKTEDGVTGILIDKPRSIDWMDEVTIADLAEIQSTIA